jgi:hypothetical protein
MNLRQRWRWWRILRDVATLNILIDFSIKFCNTASMPQVIANEGVETECLLALPTDCEGRSCRDHRKLRSRIVAFHDICMEAFVSEHDSHSVCRALRVFKTEHLRSILENAPWPSDNGKDSANQIKRVPCGSIAQVLWLWLHQHFLATRR